MLAWIFMGTEEFKDTWMPVWGNSIFTCGEIPHLGRIAKINMPHIHTKINIPKIITLNQIGRTFILTSGKNEAGLYDWCIEIEPDRPIALIA